MEAPNELVSNIAHDIKSPLATVKEALSLMLEGASGEVSEKQEKYLGICVDNVERVLRMVDGMLLSDKIARNSKRMRFSITDTAKSILDSLDMLAKKKSVVLNGSVPAKKIEIWGDPDKLNEVMSNLVENAIKYNRPEGRVDVSLEEDESNVIISVRDTGIGIPPADIGKIYERYYRGAGAQNGDIPGTGLGLAIVKDIVNMHKGNISVESESDKGTKFTVTLPKDLRT